MKCQQTAVIQVQFMYRSYGTTYNRSVFHLESMKVEHIVLLGMYVVWYDYWFKLKNEQEIQKQQWIVSKEIGNESRERNTLRKKTMGKGIYLVKKIVSFEQVSAVHY